MNLLNPSLATCLLISTFLILSPIKSISVGAAEILLYAWVPVNFLLQKLAKTPNKRGTMPTHFTCDRMRYVLKK